MRVGNPPYAHAGRHLRLLRGARLVLIVFLAALVQNWPAHSESLVADGISAEPAATGILSVCADPDNLPYSNLKEEGFENRIAKILAADLHLELRYLWQAQRRGFFRQTLLAGRCDIVLAVPTILKIASLSRPYFSSAYVAVSRTRDDFHIESLDDPVLATARIGLQQVGAEGANPPPAMALAVRGITRNITGFPMWATGTEINSQGKIIDAVAAGQIDIALVWGPFAGYFAKPYGDRLRMKLLHDDPRLPGIPFTYGMAVGVRHSDSTLGTQIQAALDRHKQEIDAILSDYGVPLAPATKPDSVPPNH